MKESDVGYAGFGEAYFSTIRYNDIKGWNYHKEMTLNLVVPIGEVTFVIYDDREKSHSKGVFFKVELSPSNYKRLTIPPRLWMAFKGEGVNTNLILNIANIVHDPNEIEKLHLNKIPYNFESI
jgi:dTDP-4-dehydrorhamnose 3,5-epimerase